MDNDYDIAIVGMSCRLPGARNVGEFWRNLAGGVESISRLSDEEILASGVPAAYLSHPNYVKCAPVLEDPGHFDASFFGFSPSEARSIDPQHRILLELAHEALENAGYDPDRYPGRIGVFTGSALNTYFTSVGLNNRLAEEYIPTLIGNDKDFLSTRISYKLNLKGPSVTVQTACSTSAVAVHLARQSLLSQETDLVLAGAISVRVPHRAGYFCDAGGVVSPDGHVRAFDAQANGTVFGSGGGILVMKRLTDAVADGDTIRAVIKGSAVNNDGSLKAGYTAPSVDSQADAVIEALGNAGVEADDIRYIEAHGSGTPVGDPIEVRALTKAFRTFTQRSGYCAIGSVKTNVGHLDAAAAVTGIIKTALALEHRKLPPSLNFEQANAELDLATSPFYVNTRLRDWASDGPRRAGVMSTGMGGTNAHIVLEEAPETTARTAPELPCLLILSAKTETALDEATRSLHEFLNSHHSVNMEDVAYTLQTGRKAFDHRRCLVCVDREDAVTGLASKRLISSRPNESRRPVIFLLPGIGDHYVGMAHGLYESCAVFKQEVDRCSNILEAHLGVDIRTVIYPPGQSWKRGVRNTGIDLKKMLGGRLDAANDPDTKALNTTLFAQPALFTIECAMARLWQSLGVVPDAIVGHSMGEYVAAYLSGVMSLEDALGLIATRAKLVDQLPHGAMLAVALPENEVLSLLPANLSIALINGPSLCVVAGPKADVSDFEKMLTSRGAICRHVANAHAFHSRMLDPIVNALERQAATVRLQEPAIRYTSNVSGNWITTREATDPAYWSAHANHTARFGDALRQLWQFKNPILLEVGPGRTLGVLAMQHPDRRQAKDPVIASSLRHHYENESDIAFILRNVGVLWSAGADIKWDGLYGGRRPRRVPLPTYPFERQRYWIEHHDVASAHGLASASRAPAHPRIEDWFYVPTWERTPFPVEIDSEVRQTASCWLIFADRWGGGLRAQEKLRGIGATARIVRFGDAFVRHADGSFQINASNLDDYLALFQELDKVFGPSLNILHFGCLTADDDRLAQSSGTDEQDFGFFSLLYIAQAIGELGMSIPVRVGMISNRIHDVTGSERLDPAMSTVLGACGVIPKEFPNIACFNIDLADARVAEDPPDHVIDWIISEFGKPDADAVIAYRGNHRWKRKYERVKLPARATSQAAAAKPVPRRLRHRGVYLITGGAGGLGLAFAKYLAESCQARIALTKKTAFPARSRWKELLNSQQTAETVRSTIKELLEIERLGGEVEVFVAEVTDHHQMQSVIDEVVGRFQTINGVFHAAGIVRAGLVQAKTKQVAASVLAPKLEGTRVLFERLKDMPLDFAVLFSSVSSITTPYAHVDYSAANCFLDAFANYFNSKGSFHTVAISWPVWKEVGIVSRLESLLGAEALKEQALERAILTKDGLDAFARALNSDLSHIIVSPEDLNHLLKEAAVPVQPKAVTPLVDAGARAGQPDGKGERQHRSDEIEAAIGEIWSGALGLDKIGVHDNFAQLGGHSLLAMQIVAKIRSTYRIKLALREFFEAPTISQLTAIVERRIAAGPGGDAEPQAPRPFSPMGQRLFSPTTRQTALFLGSDSRQIFAVYHPAAQDGCRVLTVICPPLFNEYMRTQLALRELAISLAEKGQHVVRFDYRGTGDSSGDLRDVSVSDWIDDIELAVREGSSLSGSSCVRLLAVRAGALIACKAAIARDGVERLVLWDPVPDGGSYLQKLRLVQEAIFARDTSLSEKDRKESLHDYGGYRLSERLAEEFGALETSTYSSVPNSKLYVVSTSPQANFPTHNQHLAPFAWNWETASENLIMPKAVLESLSTWLTLS